MTMMTAAVVPELRTLDIVARSRGVIAPDPEPDLDLFLVFAAFPGGSPGCWRAISEKINAVNLPAGWGG
jgi:hypothetical protein